MARDFMGMNSKQPLYGIKEEFNDDGFKDSGFTKGSGSAGQWPFSNKVSAAESQKSFNHDGKVGFHFSLTPNSVQHDDVKMLSLSNQANSVSLRNSFPNKHFVTAGQNMNGNNLKLSLHGGIPVTTPQSYLPTIGSVNGMIESCNNVKTYVPSSQLTIFYAGTVNVFDNISAEKAQAIMLLAGNGLTMASNIAQTEVQAPGHSVLVSQPANTPLSSSHRSPISVSSYTGAQSGSGSTSTVELLAVKTTGAPTTPISNAEPPKVVNTITMVASAIPQARKASLARFLEKRKERVMNAAPYTLNKKSEECSAA